MSEHLLPIYDPLPISLSHGEGVWLWDKEKKQYLDGISGIGVNILGYAQREWIAYLRERAEQLVHVSNMFTISEQRQLANVLCEKTGMEKAFFTNSGSEANETAIKLARLYGNQLGITDPTILVFDGAFHGWSLATLTASGFHHVQTGYEPLTSGFARSNFGCLQSLENLAHDRHDIVAVIIEPIKGAGGIHVAPKEFLGKMRQLCDQKQWLMITDEIQSGMGRTGEFLALQHFDLKADIVTLSKGLANGIPIGACLTQGKANFLFSPGKHGSTMGGNPLACAMAVKTLEIMDKKALIANVRHEGELLFKLLQEQLQHHPLVKEIRGKGFMIGIELNVPCKPIIQCALKAGLIINVVQQNTIRLLPPLIMKGKEIEILCQKLVTTIDDFY